MRRSERRRALRLDVWPGKKNPAVGYGGSSWGGGGRGGYYA